MHYSKVMRVMMIFVCMVSFARGKHLPEVLKPYRCPANSKDLNQCVQVNGNKVIGLLVKGIPELGVRKLDPMEFEFVKLIDTPQLHMNLSKITIHGLGDVVMTESNANMEKGILRSTLGVGNLTIEGSYAVDGQVSVMPIKGSGHFSIYLKNGVFIAAIQCSLIKESNGDEHFKRQNITIDYQFDGIVFNFENLFDGNAQLGKEINTFFNENWKQVLSEFGPGIIQVLIGVIEKMFDKFATIPIHEYFS